MTKHLSHSLKSVDSQTTRAQTVAASRVYDAIGNITSSTGTFVGLFGYGGGFGYQEEATGLKLLGHRMYDSSTGRFLTRDPIKDGRDWYVYCDNDPVGFADPDGLVRQQLIREAFLYVLRGLETGSLLKFGKTVSPSTRYSKPALRRLGARLEVIGKYDDEATCLADERELIKKYPGPLNKEVWRGRDDTWGVGLIGEAPPEDPLMAIIELVLSFLGERIDDAHGGYEDWTTAGRGGMHPSDLWGDIF